MTVERLEYRFVNFRPWVGCQYGSRSRFGLSVLVLGESHYEWLENQTLAGDVTEQVTRERMQGAYRFHFHTNIAEVLAGRKLSNEESAQVWNSVAFYNYVQYSVGKGANMRPSREKWNRSVVPFFEILHELRPVCVLVLGKEVWNHLPPTKAGPVLHDGLMEPETWLYPSNHALCLASFLKHPSRGFNSAVWHPRVANAIDAAQSLAKHA